MRTTSLVESQADKLIGKLLETDGIPGLTRAWIRALEDGGIHCAVQNEQNAWLRKDIPGAKSTTFSCQLGQPSLKNPKLLVVAKERGGSITFEIKFPDGRFEGVHTSELLATVRRGLENK